MKAVMSIRKKQILILITLILLAGASALIIINRMYARYRPYITSSYMLSSFSDEYIEKNKGRYMIEIPITFELMHVVMALTQRGLDDTHLINKNSDYYSNVIEHFLPYRDHPAVIKLDEVLNQRSTDSLGTVFAFEFEGGKIKHNNEHSADWHFGSFTGYLELLEDFYQMTGFEAFYNDHLWYYQKIIDEYDGMVDLTGMWIWLEDHFPDSHDILRIVSSPLIGGSHYTHNFRDRDKNISEIVAFAPLVISYTASMVSEELKQAVLSRAIFTEINHNYINPVTDRLLNLRKAVNIFSDREYWYNGPGYDNPAFVFNEYMTWAVFSMFAYDHYDKDIFDEIDSITVRTMVENRMFLLFGEFNEKLLDLFENKEGKIKVFRLYRDILKFASEMTK